MVIDLKDPRHRWLWGKFEDCVATASEIDCSALAALATNGLSICCNITSNPPREVIQVIRTGCGKWRDAHAAFDAVRELTLKAEQHPRANNDVEQLLLYVAENAARVIYNASTPDDPFDVDSMAWLLSTMALMVQSLESPLREELARRLAALIPHQMTESTRIVRRWREPSNSMIEGGFMASESLREHVHVLVADLTARYPELVFEGIRVVEIGSRPDLDVRGRFQLHDEYEERFHALLREGFAWLNVSCYGLLQGALVVAIEVPGSHSTRGRRTSVNYSGPTAAVVEHNWDATTVLAVR